VKLEYAKAHVSSSSSLGVTQASIDINPTIMHVLSRDLYQRPIEALFREILTNALDAHVEAGQTKPVQIQMPNMFNEEFYIRDYGLGLSVERITELYLVYGKSTRRESNEYAGAFGLGCKSPLAYTSAFMVTSYHKGMKHEFVVYYDQDNLPCLDHKTSEPTEESSGLKVSLSMNTSTDYMDFRAAASKILPRINALLWDILDTNKAWMLPEVFSPPSFDLFGKLRFTENTNTLKIVMGWVAYDVDITAIENYLYSKSDINLTINNEIYPAQKTIQLLLANKGLEIYVEVGSYPIHPSREYINITPRTIRQLCLDVQEGLSSYFNNLNPGYDSDAIRYKITGYISDDFDIKLRVCTRNRNAWTINRHYISTLIRKYSDALVSCFSPSTTAICFLSDTDLVDYLGNNRGYYSFPDNLSSYNSVLFFSTSNNIEEVRERFNIFPVVDVTEDIISYKRAAEYNLTYSSTNQPNVKTRTIVRSMQDPKHNVLVYTVGDGSKKRDWNSTQHNVESLRALKREIFWVSTKMGCVQNLDYRKIISKYNDYSSLFPKWKKPIILGLPATKGTKTIERAFKPLIELDTWMNDFEQSDYAQRRYNLYTKKVNIIDNVTNAIEEVRAYKPANMLFKILNNKLPTYRLYLPHKIHKDITDIVNDISIKFPTVSKSYNPWARTSPTGLRQWSKDVAVFTNQLTPGY